MWKKILKYFSIIMAIMAVLSFFACYISPASFWPASFAALFTPFLIFTNIILGIVWIFVQRKRALIHLAVLLIGFFQVKRTFTISISDTDTSPLVTVTNYNVRVFNRYSYLRDDDYASSKEGIEYLKTSDSDVICLQEYYSLDSSSVFNIEEQMSAAGFKHRFVSPSLVNRIGAKFGLAIFSKHPILKSELIRFKNSRHNQAQYVEILKSNDTIGIYNVHFQSISLNFSKFQEEKEKGNLIQESRGILSQLKWASIKRSEQVNVIVNHLKKSGIPVIVAGDFNDTPYSYTYRMMRSRLKNSFEKKGNGFGFTYNGSLLLRIDNQFFSKDLKCLSFETDRDLKVSDHYPITASYAKR